MIPVTASLTTVGRCAQHVWSWPTQHHLLCSEWQKRNGQSFEGEPPGSCTEVVHVCMCVCEFLKIAKMKIALDRINETWSNPAYFRRRPLILPKCWRGDMNETEAENSIQGEVIWFLLLFLSVLECYRGFCGNVINIDVSYRKWHPGRQVCVKCRH